MAEEKTFLDAYPHLPTIYADNNIPTVYVDAMVSFQAAAGVVRMHFARMDTEFFGRPLDPKAPHFVPQFQAVMPIPSFIAMTIFLNKQLDELSAKDPGVEKLITQIRSQLSAAVPGQE